MSARERLIEATADQLWIRGYTGTSPRSIQVAADAGQGSMYHHFHGKADLARAAIEHMADGLLAEGLEILDRPGDPIDRIEAWLFKPRDRLRGCRLGRLVSDPDVVNNEELLSPIGAVFAHLAGRIAEILRTAQSTGRLDPSIDADDLAALVVSAVQGGYVLARAGQDAEVFDRSVRGAAALLRRACRTPASKRRRTTERVNSNELSA
ncbi:MAG: TetR/AcrR family transcriptional regulator [Actinomycetota bacterium]|nr:TetR/AcrR family transcriptional regulator [Actinomycetota bacterium]